MLRSLFIGMLICLSLNAVKAEGEKGMKFEENKDIAHNAEIYALSAIDFAKDHYNITLDFSDDSIKKVEEILDHLHKSSLTEKPTDEKKWKMAKVFGSYIGEVFRRNHGAKWGLMQYGDEEFTGMEMDTSLF